MISVAARSNIFSILFLVDYNMLVLIYNVDGGQETSPVTTVGACSRCSFRHQPQGGQHRDLLKLINIIEKCHKRENSALLSEVFSNAVLWFHKTKV